LETLAVIWAPARTLASVAEERRVLLGFVVTALYAALSLVGAGLAVFGGLTQAQFQQSGGPPSRFNDFLPAFNVSIVVFAVVWPFVFWLLVSGLMQLVTRFFGGTGPFSGMLAVVGVAQVPLVILSVVGLSIGGLQIALGTGSSAATVLGSLNSLLSLAAFLWFAALVIVGAAFARRVGYGQSAGSCAISCAGCAGLIILTFVVIIAIIAVVAGSLNSTGTT
jgi:Yip1 domain